MIEGDASVQKLKERFPSTVLDTSEFREETTAVIRAADIVPICQFLHDDPEQAYDLCLFVSAIDQLELGLSPRFVAIWQLYSLKHHRRLRLKAPLSDQSPTVDSVASVWRAADWLVTLTVNSIMSPSRTNRGGLG